MSDNSPAPTEAPEEPMTLTPALFDFLDSLTEKPAPGDEVMTIPPVLLDSPVVAPVPSEAVTETDATDAPTFSPTQTYPPTVGPTATAAPTSSYSTFEPTFFPSYYTETDEPAPADAEAAKPEEKEPTFFPSYWDDTQSPTFMESEMDTISQTGAYVPPPVPKPTPAPVPAVVENPQGENVPQIHIDLDTTTLASVKGMTRRKSIGFQSAWGTAHAGAMVYDFTRNSIYMTGTNIKYDPKADFQRSTCFVGELPIADARDWKIIDDPKPPIPKGGSVKSFEIPGSLQPTQIMGCHLIHYDDASLTDENLYVGGVTEIDSTARDGEATAFLNAYERSRNTPDWKLKKQPILISGQSQDVPLPTLKYPVAMINGKTGDQDYIIVVSVNSDDGLMTEQYIENHEANSKNNQFDTLLPPGFGMGDPSKYAVPKRGSHYYMTWTKYDVDKKGVTLRRPMEYKLTNDPKSSTYPTGFINLDPNGGDCIMAGTTYGKPPAQTNIPAGKNPDTGESKNHDMDGFVTRFFHARGRPMFDRNTNYRFSSKEMDPPLDDHVHGICEGVLPDSSNPVIEDYYVVGSTYGTMPKGKKQPRLTTNIVSDNVSTDGNSFDRLAAWVTKMRKGTPIWTTQLYAINTDWRLVGGATEALGCKIIDSHPDSMYVAGTVYNGGLMDSTQRSAGGDDVWVAKLSTEDGSLKWIRQIGSAGDDRLARTKGIDVDLNGHAIVYGSTTGEMYRTRESGETYDSMDGTMTDLFVTTFDLQSGETESTVEFDRVAKRGNVAGGLVAAFLVVGAVFGFWYARRGRLAKGRSKPRTSDENLNNAFQDEPDSDIEDFDGGGEKIDMKDWGLPSSGYSDDAADVRQRANGTAANGGSAGVPPQEAFRDAADVKMV